MLSIFLVLLISACLICFIAPRYSLPAILLIGFTQDSFRKLVEGEPFFFVVMVGVVFGVVFLTTLNRVGANRTIEPFTGWSTNTSQPLSAFLILLAAQFFHSYLRFGSPVISLIGLISYLAPFFAIVVGYYSVNRAQDIRRFMLLYVVAGLLVALTVVMSFLGIEWAIFKEVGSGLKIYDQGTVLRSYSGFMRTGEVAAWHCAITACFIIVLFMTSKSKKSAILVIALVAFLLTAAALTGRRKMVMLFSVFVAIYFFGFLFYAKKLSLNYLILFGLGFSFLFRMYQLVKTLVIILRVVLLFTVTQPIALYSLVSNQLIGHTTELVCLEEGLALPLKAVIFLETSVLLVELVKVAWAKLW